MNAAKTIDKAGAFIGSQPFTVAKWVAIGAVAYVSWPALKRVAEGLATLQKGTSAALHATEKVVTAPIEDRAQEWDSFGDYIQTPLPDWTEEGAFIGDENLYTPAELDRIKARAGANYSPRYYKGEGPAANWNPQTRELSSNTLWGSTLNLLGI